MKHIKRLCFFSLLLILGSNELATSQYQFWSPYPIRCCSYTPLGVDDHAVTVSICWYWQSFSNGGCPVSEQCWGTITINGSVYTLQYIDINDANNYCCVLG